MRVNFLTPACAATFLFMIGCGEISVPPQPNIPQPISSTVKSLRLRVAPVTQGGTFGDLMVPLQSALEDALTDLGMTPTRDPGVAEGDLVVWVGEPQWDFGTYDTQMSLRGDQGRLIDKFEYKGGSMGSNFNRHGDNAHRIAEGLAANLVSLMIASPKFVAYAKERAEARPAAAAPGENVDKKALKALMVESLREASGAAKSGDAQPPAIISDVDKPRFQSPEHPGDFAVVVGVEKYANELPEARYAERDAKSVKNTLLAMGYPERNIKLLIGDRAARSALEAYLEDWLPKNVKEGGSVFFYFSGHGSPDPASGQAYLIPFDGDPAFLDRTGYPLKRLYSSLNALKAKQVIVALDSCFSGAGGRSVLPAGTRPLVSKVSLGDAGGMGKLVVLAASAGNQISGTDDAQGHGLFTYYLLRGLNGPAASADGSVTVKGLFEYLSPKVEDEASRANRGQSPQLLIGEGASDLRLR